jgi:hypothetical protein
VLSYIVIVSRSSERDACFSQMKHSDIRRIDEGDGIEAAFIVMQADVQ